MVHNCPTALASSVQTGPVAGDRSVVLLFYSEYTVT
jgi:hypothetical protein